MAIMFEPKGDRKNTEISSTPDVLPLGQKPEGDQFNNALLKLENTFNLIISRVNALEENLNKLQKTTERNSELIKTIVIFSDKLSWVPKDKEEPLVLTKEMEVTNGSK
jgi:hypothetical protein